MNEQNQNPTPQQHPGRRRPRNPLPPELHKFNVAAFFTNYYWAFTNGFNALGCLLAIPFGLLFLSLFAFDFGSVPIAGIFLVTIVALSILMGFIGNLLVWKAYDFKDVREFYESQQPVSRPGCMAGFGILHLVLACFLMMTLGMRSIARDHSRFNACHLQLTNLQIAVQDYLTKGGKLRDIDGKVGNLCVHMYDGAENPADCSTLLMLRIDMVCEEKSFRAKILGEDRFEFTTVAKNRAHTKICATENAVLPAPHAGIYNGENKFQCDHSGSPLEIAPPAADKAAPAPGTAPLLDVGGLRD